MELSDLIADVEGTRLANLTALSALCGAMAGLFNLDGMIDKAEPVFTNPVGAFKRKCKGFTRRIDSYIHKKNNCSCKKGSQNVCTHCSNEKTLGYYETKRNGNSKKMSPARARVEKEISKTFIAGSFGVPYAHYDSGDAASNFGEALIYTTAARAGFEFGNKIYNFGNNLVKKIKKSD
jgi:hypothetical protein|tara:strand:+ start:483 stop:1016 length:534 start_codon:yes stop_codon:yes gene_type:complete